MGDCSVCKVLRWPLDVHLQALGGWGSHDRLSKTATAFQQGLPELARSAAAGLYDVHMGSNGPGGHHAARRSLTNLSELGAEKSPESANRFRAPPESLEAQLSHKLQAGRRHSLPAVCHT